MNCKKCGFLLSNQDQNCPNCGEPNELFANGPVVPTEPVAPVAPVPPVAPVTPTVEPVTPEPVTPTVAPEPVMPEPVAPAAPAPAVETVASAPTPTVEPVAPVAPATPNVQPGSTPTVGITQTQIQKPEQKKGNKGFIILIIGLLLVIAGLGTFIGIKLLGGDNGNSGSSGGSGGNSGGNGNGGGNVVVDPVDDKNTVTIGGVEYTIPTDLVEKEYNGSTYYVNQTSRYLLTLNDTVYGYTMNDVKAEIESGIDEIKNSVVSSGGTFIGTSDYVANGRTYYVVSFTDPDGLYYDTVCTEVLTNYIFVGKVIYAPGSKELGYAKLDTVLKSAKEPSASSFAPSTSKPLDIIKNPSFVDGIE